MEIMNDKVVVVGFFDFNATPLWWVGYYQIAPDYNADDLASFGDGSDLSGCSTPPNALKRIHPLRSLQPWPGRGKSPPGKICRSIG